MFSLSCIHLHKFKWIKILSIVALWSKVKIFRIKVKSKRKKKIDKHILFTNRNILMRANLHRSLSFQFELKKKKREKRKRGKKREWNKSNLIYDIFIVTSWYRVSYHFIEIDFVPLAGILFLRVFFKGFEKAVSGGGKEWKNFQRIHAREVSRGNPSRVKLVRHGQRGEIDV